MKTRTVVCSILCVLMFSGCIYVKCEGRPPSMMPIHRIEELEERERALDQRAEEIERWEQELNEREKELEER